MSWSVPYRKSPRFAAMKPSRRWIDPVQQLEGRRLLAAHILGSPTVYSTIQAAVNAAASGATINVDPGVYAELVTINKPLTLRGTQAGVDARGNVRQAGNNESILTGYNLGNGVISSSFYINSNDVTVDGFTVQGNTSTGKYGAGIVIAPRQSGAHILNNIIQNNVSGLFLANYSSSDPAVITNNVFRNNNNDGANGGRGIYTDGGISGGNLTNVTIDSNAFFNNVGGAGTTTLEAAIALESLTPGSQSNLRITNNSFDNNGKAVLFFNSSAVTVQGNAITWCKDQWSGALRFEGGDSNISITGNTVYANSGPAIRIDNKAASGNNSNITFTGNNFTNNSGAYGTRAAVVVAAGQYSGVLNAQNNWWGDPSGPGGDGPGTGDTITSSGVSENFSPWSTAPAVNANTPYWGVPFGAGAPIQATDFNHGGEGVAYHDSAPLNLYSQYRITGVGIGTTRDAGNGFDVNKAVAGEWLDYTINAAQASTYRLDFRIANSQVTGGTFHASIDGQNVTAALTVPFTGGAEDWRTISAGAIQLAPGLHVLQLAFDSNGSAGTVGNFNWLAFTDTVNPAAPTNLTAAAVSASVINLNWQNDGTGQTGFSMERSTDAVNFSPLATVGANTTNYADNTVLATPTYYYRVRAINAAGTSAPSNIAGATVGSVYLSDLPWVSATAGYSVPQKDTTIGGNHITLRGVTYSRGIGTHAASQIVYNLNGPYSNFISDVGIDDEVNGRGSVDFQVIGDGRILFDSGVLSGTSPAIHINVSTTGVSQLTLVANNGLPGIIDYDHADWAGARLVPVSAAASFVRADLSTAGSWTGVYGANGYSVFNGASALPAYAQVAPAGQSSFTWTPSTSDPRALQTSAGSGSRLAACMYSATAFTIDLNLTDGESHQVALYLLDWDTIGRTQSVQVTDAATGTPLDNRTISNFQGGQWLVWSLSGHVKITLSRIGGANAVASALMFDGIAGTTAPPSAPAGLGATASSATQVTLNWTASSGTVTAYHVERSTDGVNFTDIAPGVQGTAYTDSTAQPNTAYTYRVRAENSGTFSGYSNLQTVSTPAQPVAPPAPANLVVTGVMSGAVSLSWSASAGATGYSVLRMGPGDASFVQIGQAASTSFTDSTVSPATSYSYGVLATNSAGNSVPSAQVSATTPANSVAPAAPSGLSAVASNSGIVLSWNAGTDTNLAGYNVFRASSPSGPFAQLNTALLTTPSYSDLTAPQGTVSYYQVTAVNTAGLSSAPASASATRPAPASSASGSFLRADVTTQGSWGGVYGTDGFWVFNATQSLPAYAQVTASGAPNYTWATSTSDVRALQTTGGAASRIAATIYSGASFSFDVNLTDGQSHQVALYLLDWDTTARAQSVQVSDAASGTVLDMRDISGFHAGEWLVWNLSGHVKITITHTGGLNAVASGLMFDTPSHPLTASGAATFVRADSATQGTWSGVYGADGYSIFNSTSALPSYAQVGAAGSQSYTWSSTTTDPRAVQTAPGAGSRIAATLYSSSSFTLDVNLSDGQSHQVALYMVDWDSTGRAQTVQLSDGTTGAVLDTQTVSGFHNGQWLVWNITGHVKITITRTAGMNAVASALMFGPAK